VSCSKVKNIPKVGKGMVKSFETALGIVVV
jgi:hypothetical protein